MILKLWLFPMACIYLLLISATSIKIQPTPVPNESQFYSQSLLASTTVKENKPNFFQRLMLKMAVKRYKANDTSKANRQANSSLIFGIAACGLLVLGLLVPFIILLSIPAGIIAMITGRNALNGGTEKPAKARTGKALGLGALIAFGVLIIAALIFIAAWGGLLG